MSQKVRFYNLLARIIDEEHYKAVVEWEQACFTINNQDEFAIVDWKKEDNYIWKWKERFLIFNNQDAFTVMDWMEEDEKSTPNFLTRDEGAFTILDWVDDAKDRRSDRCFIIHDPVTFTNTVLPAYGQRRYHWETFLKNCHRLGVKKGKGNRLYIPVVPRE